MFYTIYKTTNKIDGKIYIGKHQTTDPNDNYMGSGKLISRAIKKHGTENFEKEILFVFDSEAEMNAKEAELVTEEFVKEDTNYNLCPGGHGGFGYINGNNKNIPIDIQRQRNPSIIEKQKENSKKSLKLLRQNEEWLNEKSIKQSKAEKKKYESGYKGAFFGKTHTEEWKINHSKYMSGRFVKDKSSQYGTMWIYSIEEKRSIKIMKTDPIPDGWYKGRKIKFD